MENESIVPEVSTTNYKILAVDDVVSNILLLKALLKSENYQIITAEDGKEALEKVASELPDLILLDVMMPGLSGFEVAEKLKDSPDYSDIPIIFLTALNSHDDIVKGFELGAHDFITKPFNKNELKIRIKHQISLIEAKCTILKQTNELRSIIVGRDKLYSVIAHDLRGPLGSIKMILNLVLETLCNKSNHNKSDENVSIDQELLNLMRMANQTTEETFGLLDNLLKWTKSQLGKLNVAQQNADISDIINDGIEIFATSAELKGVNIAFERKVATQVTVDHDMIKTVVRNLLSNAIKFTDKGGTVSISIDADDTDFVFVHVHDNGCGISEENKAKLFNVETHYSTFGTSNEDGSGLGLLLCYDFVNKNGGYLWLESVEGEGSTFSFSVPKSKN